MTTPGRPAAPSFSSAQAKALRDAGWILVDLPAGLTLDGLRAAGAPFKGGRYFTRQAAETDELSTVATPVAVAPTLHPGTLGVSLETISAQMRTLTGVLPEGTAVAVAPAAAYVWLLGEYYRRLGHYPFAQQYTWALDRFQRRANLVVGVFGRDRPIVVAPVTEGAAPGIGLWPIVLPGDGQELAWPPVSPAAVHDRPGEGA